MTGRRHTVLATALWSSLAFGCGGGGGDGASGPGEPLEQLLGDWFARVQLTRGGCGAQPLDMQLGVVKVTPEGESTALLLFDNGSSLTGQVEDGVARLSGTAAHEGTVVTSANIELLFDGSGWKGSGSWTGSSPDTGPCSGLASWRMDKPLKLVSSNLDGASNVPLNEVIVLEFSADLDPASLTPSAIVVDKASSELAIPQAPIFEALVVRGRRAALFPNIPSFTDSSDLGLWPAHTYSVRPRTFSDGTGDVLRSAEGIPLTHAPGVTFSTASSPLGTFVEPRRLSRPSPGPLTDPLGRGDLDGCLNDADNSLFRFPGLQSTPSPAQGLLCLVNEGIPRVIPEGCFPLHDARDVGTLAAPGRVHLPTIRVRFNEPILPLALTPFDPQNGRSVVVQLWHVADAANVALPPSTANQMPTQVPFVVQGGGRPTDVFLVPLAGGTYPEGTYAVNVLALLDLSLLRMDGSGSPNPAIGGYTSLDAGLAGVVPAGYRFYFRTLDVP